MMRIADMSNKLALMGDAPRLSGVIGRRAGSVEGHEYSDAFRSLDHVWTRNSLARFLVDPEAVAPGTSMSAVNISGAEADAIAGFIGSRGLLAKSFGDWRRMIRARFDVYRLGRRLAYAKAPCSGEDMAPKFFLHLVPEREADLPDKRRRHGFDNLDFSFAEREHAFGDGMCSVTVELPEYPVRTLRTGQYVRGADGKLRKVWEKSHSPGRPE